MSFASEALAASAEKPVTADDIKSLQAASQSLVAFRKRFLAAPTDTSPAPFHYRWSDILLHRHGHYAIQGFRESAKDQIVFQANLLHALTYPVYSRSYIIIIAANKTQASQKLKDITRQYQAQNNGLMRFNVKKIIEDSGDAFQVQYKDGLQVRIEAYGKGAAVRGVVWGAKRPDIVLLNDIQAAEDMDSETTLDKDWHWFLSDIKFLGNSSRIFIIGNNMGPNCVIERIFTHQRELGFTCERVPMINADGTAAWPERFPIEFCLGERRAYEQMGEIDIWERERMCKAMAEESHPLHSADLNTYDEVRLDLSDMAVITMTDPGISLKKTADPTVIITVGITQENNWYILEVDRRRRNPDEQINDIFRAVSRWQPSSVGIETIAYQEALAFNVEQEQKRRNIFFNVARVRTRVNKVVKIRNRLQPMLRAGRIYVPMHAEWVNDLKAELDAFPVGTHDDIIDALSMIEDARVDLLVPQFNTRICVARDVPIPLNWPMWGSMVSDSDGEAVILLGTCSPEGYLTVIDEVYARLSPEELFQKYKEMVGNRSVLSISANREMFRERRESGKVRAAAYSQAGFILFENRCDYSAVLPLLSSYFRVPEGSRPKLQIGPKCRRLLWELYNAVSGELKQNDRKAIQALLQWLNAGPKWRDMKNEPMHNARNIKYPKPDIP